MAGDDSVHQSEPHAGTLTRRFGGEKRLKDALLDFGGNTMAGIAYGEAHIRPHRELGMLRCERGIGRHGLQVNLQDAAGLAHGVFGVATEV